MAENQHMRFTENTIHNSPYTASVSTTTLLLATWVVMLTYISIAWPLRFAPWRSLTNSVHVSLIITPVQHAPYFQFQTPAKLNTTNPSPSPISGNFVLTGSYAFCINTAFNSNTSANVFLGSCLRHFQHTHMTTWCFSNLFVSRRLDNCMAFTTVLRQNWLLPKLFTKRFTQ